MADTVNHLATLTILGGPLHGHKVHSDEMVDELLVGSDPDCRFCIDLPSVSPIHCRIWLDLSSGATVYDTHAPSGVFVNFDRVVGQAPLGDGDMLWLGPPQAPGSVLIQPSFEEVTTSPPVPVAAPELGASPVADASADGPPVFEVNRIETPPPVVSTPAPPSLPREERPVERERQLEPEGVVESGDVASPSEGEFEESLGEAPVRPPEILGAHLERFAREFAVEQPADSSLPDQAPSSDDASGKPLHDFAPAMTGARESPGPALPDEIEGGFAGLDEPQSHALGVAGNDSTDVASEPADQPVPPRQVVRGMPPPLPTSRPLAAAAQFGEIVGAPPSAGSAPLDVETAATFADLDALGGFQAAQAAEVRDVTDEQAMAILEAELGGAQPVARAEPLGVLDEEIAPRWREAGDGKAVRPMAPTWDADEFLVGDAPQAEVPVAVPASHGVPNSPAPGPAVAEGDEFFITDGAAPPSGTSTQKAAGVFGDDPLGLPSVPQVGDDGRPIQADDFLFDEPAPGPPASAPVPPPPPAPAPASPARMAVAPPVAAPPALRMSAPAERRAVPPLPPRQPPLGPSESQVVSRVPRAGVAPATRRQAPAKRASSGLPLSAILGGVGAFALLAGSGYFGMQWFGGPQLRTIEPVRARVGQTVVLGGQGFGSEAQANEVVFGTVPGVVQKATARRLEVVVPEIPGLLSGQEQQVEVRVRRGRRESDGLRAVVFSGPTIHGISPDVAMPGEEITLAGTGFVLGCTVRFGATEAQVVETQPNAMRVLVPVLDAPLGSPLPVVVAVAGVESNPGPFFVGRIPMVTKVEPAAGAPGDEVVVSGRGFRRERTQNEASIGGGRALVVAAMDQELRLVVPRVPAGRTALQISVPSSQEPASIAFEVRSPGERVPWRFVGEPFQTVPGRDHAVLGTGLGPTIVLASSGGRSSAERAFQAAKQLDAAGSLLAATRDPSIELRSGPSGYSLGVVGRPEPLLEVTPEDAAAYGEDWTGLKGRGGAVTVGRLGRWWEAIMRDLALMLVKGQPPHFAADLAPEGRPFVDLFQSAQHVGTAGIPASTVAALKPAQRTALQLAAYRVPVGVGEPTAAAGGAAPPLATAPLRADGVWSGSETEVGSQTRYISLSVAGRRATLTLEGAVSLDLVVLDAEATKSSLRFSVESRGGRRYYSGKWDGTTIRGTISTDAAGRDSVGTFELKR